MTDKIEYTELLLELENLKSENANLKNHIRCLTSVADNQTENVHESQLFQQLLDNMPDSIYFKDKQSRFIFASRTLCNLFKISECNQVKGKTDFDFFSAEHAQQAFDDEQQIVATGIPLLNMIEKETWPDGSQTYVTTNKLPLYDEKGEIIGTFGLSRDISSQIKTEIELKQLTEKLEQLVKERTEELEKSRERYQLLTEASTDLIFQLDEYGKVSYCSPSVYKMLGYSDNEFIQTPFLHHIAPDSKKTIDETFQNCISGYHSKLSVVELIKKNGDKIWVEINITLITSGEGILNVIGIARNVNKRMQIEEQNAILIHAVENSPVSIVITNTDGTIEYVNKQFQELTGYTSNEAIGQNPRILKSGKTPESIYTEMWNSLVNNGVWTGEIINKKKSGELYWEQARMSAVSTIDNKVTHYIAIKEDISERKKNLDLLEKNNHRLRAITEILQTKEPSEQKLLENALEKAIDITDSEIGYIYSYDESTNEFHLNSWSKDVMKQCSIANPERFYHLDQTGFWGEAVRQRKPIILSNFEAPHPLKKGYPDGHAHLKTFMTIPIFESDKIIAVVGVANKPDNYTDSDITQLSLLMESVWLHKKRLQMEIELIQKNKELADSNVQKDKFFSIIAHDLRSPFGSIAGLSHYIYNNYYDMSEVDRQEGIRLIDNSAKGITSLLDNLLDWSRSMLGRMQFNPIQIEFSIVVNEIQKLLGFVAAAKNITLTFEVSPNFVIFADRNMLNTLLRNLIGNAIKFTPIGGAVTLQAQKTNDQYLLTITDNGVGMNESTLEELFSLTKTNSGVGTSGERGTGLGLVLCKEMVERHRGTIEVETELDKGTRFIISLPVN